MKQKHYLIGLRVLTVIYVTMSIITGIVAYKARVDESYKTEVSLTIVMVTVIAGIVGLIFQSMLITFKIRDDELESDDQFIKAFVHWSWRRNLWWAMLGAFLVGMVGVYADALSEWITPANALGASVTLALIMTGLSWLSKQPIGCGKAKTLELPGQFKCRVVTTTTGKRYTVLNSEQAAEVYRLASPVQLHDLLVRVEYDQGFYRVTAKSISDDQCLVHAMF